MVCSREFPFPGYHRGTKAPEGATIARLKRRGVAAYTSIILESAGPGRARGRRRRDENGTAASLEHDTQVTYPQGV